MQIRTAMYKDILSYTSRYRLLTAILAMVVLSGCTSTARQADLVILNARVWTGTDTTTAPAATAAIAITGNRIAAINTNVAIRQWITPRTQVIDAHQRRVVPGITDSHLHLVSGGLQRSRLHLRDVTSRDEFITAIGNAASELPDGAWLLGGRWSVESWTTSSSPRKEWINASTQNHPCFLTRMDGHQALANAAALRIAGIDADGPSDPEGGVIERDPQTSEPTGILKDAAMDLVSKHIPEPSENERLAALKNAMQHLNTFGITSVHDMSGGDDLPAIRQMHRENALTVRIRKYLHVADWRDHIETVKSAQPNDDWFRIAGFKGYMDGSLGSRTAYMYHPYADADHTWDYPGGLLSDQASPPKKMRHMIEQADRAGLQSAVHAIGDEANHLLIDAYAATTRRMGEQARRHRGERGCRHRVEHAQHLLPEDIPRFAPWGIIASMQPYHKADDGRYADKALDKDRLSASYAFRSLIDANATVCFGSDWPVVTCNPFAGMQAAITAKTLDGKIWYPEQSISITEALECYTVTPAIAAFQEERLGTIEVGKLADIAILSHDIFAIPPDRLDETRAVVTIVDGRVVYESAQ